MRLVILILTLHFLTGYSFSQNREPEVFINNFSLELGFGRGNLQYGYNIRENLNAIAHSQVTLFYNFFSKDLYSLDAGLRYSKKGSDISFTYINLATKQVVPNDDNRLVRLNYVEAPVYIYRSFTKLNIKAGLGLSLGYLIGGTKYNRTVDTINNTIIHTSNDVKDISTSPFSKTSVNNLDVIAGFRVLYNPTFTKSLNFGLEFNRSLVEVFRYYNYYNSSLYFFINYKPRWRY